MANSERGIAFLLVSAILFFSFAQAEEESNAKGYRIHNSDFIVQANGTVTISEKILVPANCRFVVNDGATLLFREGGGIKVESIPDFKGKVTITAPKDGGGTTGLHFRKSPSMRGCVFRDIYVVPKYDSYSVMFQMWLSSKGLTSLFDDLEQKTSIPALINAFSCDLENCTFENVCVSGGAIIQTSLSAKLTDCSFSKTRSVSLVASSGDIQAMGIDFDACMCNIAYVASSSICLYGNEGTMVIAPVEELDGTSFEDQCLKEGEGKPALFFAGVSILARSIDLKISAQKEKIGFRICYFLDTLGITNHLKIISGMNLDLSALDLEDDKIFRGSDYYDLNKCLITMPEGQPLNSTRNVLVTSRSGEKKNVFSCEEVHESNR